MYLGCTGAKIPGRATRILLISAGALTLGVAVAPLRTNAGDLADLPGVSTPAP
jgi:hypothetical protein